MSAACGREVGVDWANGLVLHEGDTDGWHPWDPAIYGEPERSSSTRPAPCPRCGGVNGGHGLVHVRHGNGGGSNIPCPLDPAPVEGTDHD